VCDLGSRQGAQRHFGDDPRAALGDAAYELLDLRDAGCQLQFRGILRGRLVDEEDVALGCKRAPEDALGDLQLAGEGREHGLEGDDVLVCLVRQLIVDPVELRGSRIDRVSPGSKPLSGLPDESDDLLTCFLE
jgi:hypothetical protein